MATAGSSRSAEGPWRLEGPFPPSRSEGCRGAAQASLPWPRIDGGAGSAAEAKAAQGQDARRRGPRRVNAADR